MGNPLGQTQVFKNTIIAVLLMVFPQRQPLVTAVADELEMKALKPAQLIFSYNVILSFYKASQKLTLGEVD